MNADFYLEWLRIPAERRPPTHFDILGLTDAETEVAVIAAAAQLQSSRVKSHQNGPHAED